MMETINGGSIWRGGILKKDNRINGGIFILYLKNNMAA
jgi:hypothetical protein